MFDVIDTFIDLNQAQPLAKLGLDVKALDGKAPLFGDTLEFTTILSASATPSLTLTAVGSRTGLAANTNFAPSAKRTDKHRVIIGLSLPATVVVPAPKALVKVEKDIDKPANGAAVKVGPKISSTQLKNPRNLSAPFVVQGVAPSSAPTPATNAKDRALDVAKDQLLLNFYNRFAR